MATEYEPRLDRRGHPRPRWRISLSAPFGDQHYVQSVQECVSTIDLAMEAEGIDLETRVGVLLRLGANQEQISRSPEPYEGEPLPITKPSGFDPHCRACNMDMHRCPGCGTPLRHGVPACDACLADSTSDTAQYAVPEYLDLPQERDS
jgi:hypothetical protein